LKLNPGVAIEEERMNLATTRAIGRCFGRVSGILSPEGPRVMLDVDETMLAASLESRQGVVIVALDQRVFRKRHKKPHHYTLGAVFNPFRYR
jgi:hypothetical protein